MQHKRNRATAALWLGFVGTSIIWFIGFLYAWIVAEFGCQSAIKDSQIFGISLVAMLQLLGRLVILAIAFYMLRYVQQILHHEISPKSEVETTRIFFARSGLIAGQILFAVMIVESIPIFFFLKSC